MEKIDEWKSDIWNQINPMNYEYSQKGAVDWFMSNLIGKEETSWLYDKLGVDDVTVPFIDGVTQGDAYKKAREQGLKEFMWKNPQTKKTQRYHTREYGEFPDFETERIFNFATENMDDVQKEAFYDQWNKYGGYKITYGEDEDDRFAAGFGSWDDLGLESSSSGWMSHVNPITKTIH